MKWLPCSTAGLTRASGAWQVLDAGADPEGPAQRGAGAQQELRAGGGGLALLGGSLELLSSLGSVFFSWQPSAAQILCSLLQDYITD